MVQVSKEKVEELLQGQKEIREDIRQMKEALFNPDTGLFTRVRENTNFRRIAGKIIWVLFTLVLGLTFQWIKLMVSK